jgi:hypothetical protein
MAAFVAYFRVSTDKQGASGLGLEAQREAVARHVAGAGGAIVAEFQEIESGKRNDRPQIAAALAVCRVRRATLIIAKLDRLARNVAFISSLMESGVGDRFEEVLAETVLHAPSWTLRGGTREILRGIIARGLGLR